MHNKPTEKMHLNYVVDLFVNTLFSLPCKGLIPGQVNFAQPLARRQVLEKIICQPLRVH
jgi:hypothetical protein